MAVGGMAAAATVISKTRRGVARVGHATQPSLSPGFQGRRVAIPRCEVARPGELSIFPDKASFVPAVTASATPSSSSQSSPPSAPFMPPWKQAGPHHDDLLQARALEVASVDELARAEKAVSFASSCGVGVNACALPANAALLGSCTYVHTEFGVEKRLVPLLSPEEDGLPFAMGVEMWGHKASAGDSDGMEASKLGRAVNDPSCVLLQRPAASGVFELHYVLRGEGLAFAAAGQEETTMLQSSSTLGVRLGPGDSIVFPPDVARAIAPAVCFDSERPIGGTGGDANFSLVTIVLVLPTDLLIPDDFEVKPGERIEQHSEEGDRLSRSLDEGKVIGPDQLLRAARAAQHAVSFWKKGTPGAKVEAAEVEAILAPVTMRASDKQPTGDTNAHYALKEHQDGNDKHGIIKKSLQELTSFHLSNAATNRFALVFDPIQDHLPFTFAVEIFEEGHVTPLHVHDSAHELFFILSGEGLAVCDGHRFPVHSGDVVVFPPRSLHGLDVPPVAQRRKEEGDSPHSGRLYTLELMLPNDAFSAFVRGGQPAGALELSDLCTLISVGCGVGDATD